MMSCWRRTAVLRVPAFVLGLQYRWQWDEFLNRHEDDFDGEPGSFGESLCDSYPMIFQWDEADFYNREWLLDQRNPSHPAIVPGPFLDYCLDEIIPLRPERNSYGQNNLVRPLDESEKKEYLPLFRRLFPHFTMKEMDAVRRCEYEWYDGSNAPYLYSDLDEE